VQRYYDVLNTRVVRSLSTVDSPAMWREHSYIIALLGVAFSHFASMSYFLVNHPYHQ